MNRRNKTIAYGDRIFARVSQNGKTVFNYMTEKVGSMTEFLSQIRASLKNLKGLVMVHIRNYNQGWGEERPLMLYAVANRQSAGSLNAEANGSVPSGMLFPWETH